MAVAHDCGDAGHAGEFMRRALGVAAGDDDSGRRIPAVRTADKGAGSAVGFGGYAAGIDDDDVGREWLVFGKRPQMSCDGLAIGTCRSAAEVLDGETHHLFSLVNVGPRSDSREAGLTI